MADALCAQLLLHLPSARHRVPLSTIIDCIRTLTTLVRHVSETIAVEMLAKIAPLLATLSEREQRVMLIDALEALTAKLDAQRPVLEATMKVYCAFEVIYELHQCS